MFYWLKVHSRVRCRAPPGAMQRWIADLARRIGRDADRNVSAAVNVAKGPGAKTSARRHQRIVQRNGERTVITETQIHGEEPEHDRQA
jgi:hypothetical protein